MLNKNELKHLRGQITLNSLFIGDYQNSLAINPEVVCNFFDSYLSYIQELADKDKEYRDKMEFHDIVEKYDNIETLWDWYNSYVEDPLPF